MTILFDQPCRRAPYFQNYSDGCDDDEQQNADGSLPHNGTTTTSATTPLRRTQQHSGSHWGLTTINEQHQNSKIEGVLSPRKGTVATTTSHSEADAAGGLVRSFQTNHYPSSGNLQSTSTGYLNRYRNETLMSDSSTNHPYLPVPRFLATINVKPDWRSRDRIKTVGIGIIMALNIGTDPPDIVKPDPCAVLQCWIDPRPSSSGMTRAKARELIGERLENQYSKWQLAKSSRPLKYRKALDPTIDDVRNVCLRLRAQAREERILIHYNGHGVPRPTEDGDIWVFDKNLTEYVTLSISDLRMWMGKPSIVVLDCSSAGVLIPFWTQVQNGTANSEQYPMPTNAKDGSAAVPFSDDTISKPTDSEGLEGEDSNDDETSSHWLRETIILCPCSEGEWLPMHPDFPADIFTSCLTTPIPIALRWFIRQNNAMNRTLHPDSVNLIPGKENDRKTPLGELNWIFTAVTDTIAWNVLPKPLFQRLFRQELLVAGLFRNFLFADRILRSFGCTPVSFPPLAGSGCSHFSNKNSSMADHPLWQAWDLACETMLYQLINDGVLPSMVNPNVTSLSNNQDQTSENASVGTDNSRNKIVRSIATHKKTMESAGEYTSSPFFSEQLTAFEIWLDLASVHKFQLFEANGNDVSIRSPEQLPVVLQVLLSQVHRIRALKLLQRFLSLGPWAVNLALSLGISPYVMKLLQSPEYKSLLVSIWASILSFDISCRIHILRDGAVHHFVQHLFYGFDKQIDILGASAGHADQDIGTAAAQRTLAAFVLSIICNENPGGQIECLRLNVHRHCCALLFSYEIHEQNSKEPQSQKEYLQHYPQLHVFQRQSMDGNKIQESMMELFFPWRFRQWLCLCLGSLVKNQLAMKEDTYGIGAKECLESRLNDKDPNVRAAACYALGCLISSKNDMFHPHQDMTKFNLLPPLANHMLRSNALTATPRVQYMMPSNPSLSTPNFLHMSNENPLAYKGITDPSLSSDFLLQTGKPGDFHRNAVVPQHRTGAHESHRGWPITQSLNRQENQEGIDAANQAYSYPHASHPKQLLTENSHHLPNFQIGKQSAHRDDLSSSSLGLIPWKSVVDKRQVDRDLGCAEAILSEISGGYESSVVVRFEALIVLGSFVEKYLEAFVIVAGDPSRFAPLAESSNSKVAINSIQDFDRRVLKRCSSIWNVLWTLQRNEPFRPILKASSSIVRLVQGTLLYMREEALKGMGNLSPPGTDEEQMPLASFNTDVMKNKSSDAPRTNARRGLSEVGVEKSVLFDVEAKSSQGIAQEGSEAVMRLDERKSSINLLPNSEFFDWKKNDFDTQTHTLDVMDGQFTDPLSPAGAVQANQDLRNLEFRDIGTKLSHRYANMAPRVPAQDVRIEVMMEEHASDVAEEDLKQKKKELEMKEKELLHNDGVMMTSLLDFHPYEDYLIACGSTDIITLWDTEKGKLLRKFKNGNSAGSRMTSSFWINEECSSLFLVGCDDGTVKVWSNVLANDSNGFTHSPCQLSAFHAAPVDLGHRGSGSVLEWQAHRGMLLAGGNSKYIRLWDLNAEKLASKIETTGEANLTTMVTPRRRNTAAGKMSSMNHDFGDDIVVAGHSDGSLKIFDIRMKETASDLRQTSRFRRNASNSYNEHNSWVVNLSFTNYAGRSELISGTVAGEIKAWDIRMSTSIRTLKVQRSIMTTFSVHDRIPMIATGSQAQFIKLITLDGEVLQVLRYHEKLPRHRIGPIGCLAFHPNKPLMAAGATNSYISLYATTKC